MRAYTGGGSALLLLSSGTEDYFVGTFYFESGLYKTNLAGVTRRNGTHAGALTQGSSFSAYRVHTADPLAFNGGVLLTWRNGDAPGCDLNGSGYAHEVLASSVALYYVY